MRFRRPVRWLQTGEYDFAWNMQVEDAILKRLEEGGKGRIHITLGGSIEHIQLNNTDPWTEVDGERSSLKTEHPSLDRHGGPQGPERPGRPPGGRGPHLRPDRQGHSELPEQPGAVRLEEDVVPS